MQQRKRIESLILTLRDQKVMLDADLAALYVVPTKRLNEQVKRNIERFPEDFMFQLTAKEWGNLKSQFATSSLQVPDNQGDTAYRSQYATGPHGGRRTPPNAFTEHGAIMAATVLNSPQAVAMSVYVVRAFVQMREQIAANAEVLTRLAEIDKTLLKHDKSLQVIWAQLQPLLDPVPGSSKRRIGFSPDDK
ncbi:MAG: ORF6N domain-containing protein [Candidatus Hydrogenedentota bacterium]